MSSPASAESSAALKHRPASLERQLNIGVGLGLAILLLAAAILICVTLSALAEQYVAERLRHDLDALISATTASGEQNAFSAERLDPAFQRASSGRYHYISDGEQLLQSDLLKRTRLDLPELALGQKWQGLRTGPDSQQLLVIAQAVMLGDRTGMAAMAEDISGLEASLHRLTLMVGTLATLALAALLWLQRTLIHRSLGPLIRLQEQLKQMERGERKALPTEDLPQEILPLVERLNSLLALLSARLERSRKAAGNLAHSLKTPLAVLTQLADDPATGACRTQLSEQLQTMRGTVDRELRRARLAGGTLSDHFDLHEAVEALLDTLTRIYRDKSLLLDVDCEPGAQFAGDREDFLELMGVLLDNAFKWANHRIQIRVTQGVELGITIEDDGPGICVSQRDKLLGRGQRLDESPAGAGLGLAIATDIIEQYQGELMLGHAQLGGLAVALQLPGRLG